MITTLRGVFLDPGHAEYLARALDEFFKLMKAQRDTNGNPAPSTPVPRLVDVAARLRKASQDANRSVGTVSTTDRFQHDRDDSGQPVLHELGTGDAARVLGVSPGAVRDLARRGRIPARYTGTRWRFDAGAVEARAQRQAGRRAG